MGGKRSQTVYWMSGVENDSYRMNRTRQIDNIADMFQWSCVITVLSTTFCPVQRHQDMSRPAVRCTECKTHRKHEKSDCASVTTNLPQTNAWPINLWYNVEQIPLAEPRCVRSCRIVVEVFAPSMWVQIDRLKSTVLASCQPAARSEQQSRNPLKVATSWK